MEQTTLDRIQEALTSFEQPDRVYYGTAAKLPKGEKWDYTVFSRGPSAPAANLTGCSDSYDVAVVREGFVPEGSDFRVIEAMRSVPGIKLDSAKSVEYRYDVKPGSRDTIEMMVVHFVKGRKR